MMKHALQELESVLMAPDADELASSSKPEHYTGEGSKSMKERGLTFSHEYLPNRHVSPDDSFEVKSKDNRPEKRMRLLMESIGEMIPNKPVNDLKELLIKCAQELSEGKIDEFRLHADKARSMVSISGTPMERLGAYMLEGLVARHEQSGTNIYKSLRCHEPEGKELSSYMHILYDICPYFKFGYMAANGSIAEALRKEDRIHIIDFQIGQGNQWVTLIQALAMRPGGPPHVRITRIEDPQADYSHEENLKIVGDMLLDMSKKFRIPLEFNALPVHGHNVTRELLDIRDDEALAVNFTLQLHHTADESVDMRNPRDGLLRMVKGLYPKVTTLVEQESNTNTTLLLTRFMETLDYYLAMFESIDGAMPRESRERIGVEQNCLAKDIVNVIACEGKDRVERHELLGKWRLRFGMAGFKPYPLSPYVNSVIRTLFAQYSDKYTLVEKDGALLLGWKTRNLISASAWH